MYNKRGGTEQRNASRKLLGLSVLLDGDRIGINETKVKLCRQIPGCSFSGHSDLSMILAIVGALLRPVEAGEWEGTVELLCRLRTQMCLS